MIAKILKKEFCFWMVSPKNGRVRKLRLSSMALGGVVLGLLLVFSVFLFVASDYGRVQLLRMRHQLSLRDVTSQRDSLRETTHALNSEVDYLKEEKRRVLSYEEHIKSRISELTSVLETASDLGVVSQGELGKITETDATKGIGGAELECGPSNQNCQADRPTTLSFSRWFSTESDEDTGEIDSRSPDISLLDTLEQVISMVKKLPLGHPAVGHVSSGFGKRRSPFSRRWKMHQGIDFSLPYGSEVKATADGVVKAVKRDATYGLVVDIQHGDRVVTRYAHLSKSFVRRGQKVCRSQTIALVGSTGRSTGPHLHYEVIANGKAKNPKRLLFLGRKLESSFAS